MADFLLTVHVLAAVLWVGGSAMLIVWGRRALASGDTQRIVGFAREAAWIGPRIFAPLSIALFLAGQLLLAELDLEHETWIILAETGWLVSFLIGVLYYGRKAKDLDRRIAEHGEDSPEVLENVRQTSNVAVFELAILLLVVVDMTVKPFL
ncbi:MAG TPA: DUF2269 family protein [Thermoleophilaceae bacterium]|nr:DUF2269 family protein [Thermoleophilaceae bacterium]